MYKLFEISQGKNSTMKQLLGFNPISPQSANNNGSILPQQDNISTVYNNTSNNNNDVQGVTQSVISSRMGSQILNSNSNHFKSLHMPYKKKEAYRIDEEN